MPSNKNFCFEQQVLSPILVILVVSSLSLAIVDKDNRSAYFDIVKIAIAYSFSSVKSQRNTEGSKILEEPEDSDKWKPPH